MERILVIPDTHVPYHDPKALSLVRKVARHFRPEHMVIIGDFADFYSVSSHSRNPERRHNLEWEVAEVNRELDKLDGLAPHTIFCEGNHEDRLRRHLWNKTPELFGLVSVKKLFKIAERGWTFIPYTKHTWIGKIGFTHDIGHSGKYALMRSLEAFGGNLVFGHTHRGGTAYLGEVRGKQHFGLNVGWLGDVEQLDYGFEAKARRDWQLGFGWINLDKRGYGWSQFIPILKGHTAVVEGRKFKC